MPYPMSRPIPVKPSMVDHEKDNFNDGGSFGRRSTSPTRSVGNRRRSSTIKNALFSILNTGGGSGGYQVSTSLPKNYSSLSVGAGETAVDDGGKARRNSTAAGEVGMFRQGRQNSNGAIPSLTITDSSSTKEGEEGRDGTYGDTLGGTSTTCSSMTNRSGGSLRSFGKEFLSEYLAERGLLTPKVVSDTGDVRISIATSGDNIFLPTMSSNDDEYLARLNGLRSDEEEAVEVEPDALLERSSDDSSELPRNSLPTMSDSSSLNDESAISENEEEDISDELSRVLDTASSGARTLRRKSSVVSANTAAPGFEIDNSMATRTIAVIISFSKQAMLTNIRGELCSRVRVYWHNGVPPKKTFYEEFYCAGSLEWDLFAEGANLFVPLNVSSNEKIIENNRNLRPMKLFKNNSSEMRSYLDKNQTRSELLKKAKLRKSQVFQPGDYVFIIPVAFSNHIPESLYMPSARINYRFRIAAKVIPAEDSSSSGGNETESHAKSTEMEQPSGRRFSNAIKKLKNNLHITNQSQAKITDTTNEVYSEYPLNVVRTPPLVSISTANKPVYINRVWANSLSYEISFAQKYVSLGSKVPVKIKLAPMCKNIFLKRLRISVIEKITFVSKNYEYEYDQVDPVAKDPYNPYFSEFASRRKKERNIALLEVRASEKGSRAIREEIVENCSNDNLLAYAAAESDGGQADIGITEPLMIETLLEFPRYEDLNKKTARTVPPYGIDLYTSIPNPEAVHSTSSHRSGVIGFLASRRSSLTPQARGNSDSNPSIHSSQDEGFHETTIKSNSGVPVRFHTNLNKTKRGLYLDSLHFSNVYSKHKLEFMLRISKIDDANPKRLRHYEVLIDTPVFLVSELCNSGNMELPTYDMATNTQPLGEVDVDAAPPTFEEAISVPGSPLQSPIISPFGSPNIRSRYDTDDLSIHQLNLSRSNSIAAPSESIPPASHPVSISHSTGANARFNNLDRLLSTNEENSSDNNDTLNEVTEGVSVTFKEPIHGPRLFKSKYTLAQKNPEPNADSDSEVDSKEDGSMNSPPPSYDEVIPLMSDEEQSN